MPVIDEMSSSKEIRIEPSTICNFNCQMCARESFARHQEIMPDDLFEMIVDRARSELPELEICTLSGFGEFAADPGWPHKLTLARRNYRRVHIVTNLSLVPDEALPLLAEQATEVRVSISAADSDTYDRIHHPPAGITFELIAAKIRRLAALRGRGLELKLTCSELEENRERIGQWVEYWQGTADHLEVWRPHNWITAKEYRGNHGLRLASCGRPASGPLQVQVDGTMNVCCFDYNGRLEIGDLKTQSFSEILAGPELLRIRDLHRRGKADRLKPCAVCDQREDPESKKRYLRHCSWADREERIMKTSSGLERVPVDHSMQDGKGTPK